MSSLNTNCDWNQSIRLKLLYKGLCLGEFGLPGYAQGFPGGLGFQPLTLGFCGGLYRGAFLRYTLGLDLLPGFFQLGFVFEALLDSGQAVVHQQVEVCDVGRHRQPVGFDVCSQYL